MFSRSPSRFKMEQSLGDRFQKLLHACFFHSRSGGTCSGTVGFTSGVAFLWSRTAHRQRLGPDV